MRVNKLAVCFAAAQFMLGALSATSLHAQSSGVPLDFGSDPSDTLPSYGFQYQSR